MLLSDSSRGMQLSRWEPLTQSSATTNMWQGPLSASPQCHGQLRLRRGDLISWIAVVIDGGGGWRNLTPDRRCRTYPSVDLRRLCAGAPPLTLEHEIPQLLITARLDRPTLVSPCADRLALWPPPVFYIASLRILPLGRNLLTAQFDGGPASAVLMRVSHRRRRVRGLTSI